MRGPRARFFASLEATIRPTAPAGVSRLCEAAIPNAGFGAGHDTLRHTSRAKPSILPPELFSLRSKAWALSGFGAAAWLPGSDCALSPCAQAIFLNGRVPGQLPLISFALRYPRQVAPTLAG